MKRKIVGLVKAICFLTILLICFIGVTKLFQRKESVIKFTPFFEEENEFDVLLFGSSHVVNGVFPMELWEDYGIVSYNCGIHGSQLATTYWTMQQVLDYKTPKLIVIDVFGVHYEGKYGLPEQLHEAFDAFPMSVTKYKAVQDLFDDSSSEDFDSRWSYFFDFDVYHTRWEELEKEDFSYEVNLEKGAESRIRVAIPKEYPMCSVDEVMEETDTVGMEYLCKMIEDCQSRGIEVLLAHIPFPCEPEWQIAANSVHEIAAKYDVEYIDFVGMNNVVEYTTDCYDSGSHLNPSGARKVTEYLGEYIVENYDIPDRREDEAYAKWHEDYEAYNQLKYANLEAQTELDRYLMLLRDENLNACIYISNDSGHLQNMVIHRLLYNATIDGGISNLAWSVQNGSDYFLVIDRAKNRATDFDLSEKMGTLTTSMGKIRGEQNQQGKQSIWIDDKKMLDSEDTNILVKVVVYDAATGEVVSELLQEREQE